MKQEVHVVLRLKLWIDATLSKKQLAKLSRIRLQQAFAPEISQGPHPITVLSVHEEAEIYGTELPARFDEYEVHGVCKFEEDGAKFCEQVPDDAAQFWSLYGHIPGEGVQCIGDFRTRKHAEDVYARITGRAYSPNRQ